MDARLQKLLPLMPSGSTFGDAERILAAVGGIDLTDLAGTAELAEELGIPKQSLCNWAAGRARKNFPAPLLKLKATPIYSRAAVLAWWANETKETS